MSANSISKTIDHLIESRRGQRLAELYETLPPDAQRSLLEKHLLPLLDALPEELSNNGTLTSRSVRNIYSTPEVLSSAVEARARFRAMPRLDLKGKKKEVNGLMDALNLDAKLAITRDRSNRDELLTEVVDSLTSWLNDIWSVAYEFHDNYHLAHVCLLFTVDVASTLSEVPGPGIKARNGKVVKSFALRGPHTLEKAVLWIWRDIFVSMLAFGTSAAKNKIPEMIEDIEMLMGWEALGRLLYGGTQCASARYDETLLLNPLAVASKSESFGDDDVSDEQELPDDGVFEYVLEDSDEGSDEEFIDGDSFRISISNISNGPCFEDHAAHWPESMDRYRIRLRELVQDRLHTLFRAMPSLEMFKAIRAITPRPYMADVILLQETNDNATKSSDTLAGALAIYSSKYDAQAISTLLSTHSHLLRPCDAEVLQTAVRILIVSGYSLHVLQILEHELLETIGAVHAALTGVFGLIDHERHKSDVEEILKLRKGSSERKDRIHRWVDSVLTYPMPMDPMAFAAMMMGFPMNGAVEEGAHEDPAGFLDDVDEGDTDWDELREEFRPPLKERFEGWYQLTELWKDANCKTLWENTYAKAVEVMPYLRGSDIVERMVVR
ncbi:hypothetical protein C0992_013338 [Termitomyces sp. T32_za158]|nr:hypothetical protein C0992_013338 [Termitomyces sp. T32_za158]